MPPRFRVLIDNDFSGDPDDLFQLAHHLLSPSVEVRGIIGSHLAPGDFLDASATTATNAVRAAQQLLEVAGVADRYPVVEGANHALVGPIRSAACDLIVQEALRASDQRLFIACGAGLTDLASALMVRPDIASKITLVWIGGPEYPDLAAPPPGSTGVEYNLNIDIGAARYVFDQPGLEIWQIPRNAYRQCLVSLAELEARVKPHGRLGDYLYHSLDRVFDTTGRTQGPDAETYVLGDQPLVLVTALQSLFEADPSSSGSVWRDRPRIGASGRYEGVVPGATVRVFTHIDTRLMFDDFYAKLAQWAAPKGDQGISTTDLGSVVSLDAVVDPALGPLYPGCPRLSGPAFTVEVEGNDNLAFHRAIYEAPPGSVLVAHTHGSRAAVAGGNVCAVAQRRGIAGFVVDGYVRDVEEIEALGFPVYARGLCPVPGTKKHPGRLGAVVSCGGVTVAPGDTVVADRDGIVVVPQATRDTVFAEATKKRNAESALTLDQWEAQHRTKTQAQSEPPSHP